MEITIQHLPNERKFVTEQDQHKAYVEYLSVTKRIIFTHTEVPVALEGKGIGSALAKYVLEYAKEQGLVVMPLCPFIAAYIRKHPEYKELVMAGFNV